VCVRDLAARCARGLRSSTALENRGRRESRVRAAPAVSRAKSTENAHTSIQVQRKQSGFPCAVDYGLLRALPGDRAFLSPSSTKTCFRELERQRRGIRTTRLRRPRQRRSSGALPRPPHPAPNVVTTAKRPS